MSIAYELALELKNAGWPQPGLNWPVAYIPTLSELIAGCPWMFEGGVFTLQNGGLGWVCGYQATGPDDKTAMMAHEIGATPEEATARLWLKLQESKT